MKNFLHDEGFCRKWGIFGDIADLRSGFLCWRIFHDLKPFRQLMRGQPNVVDISMACLLVMREFQNQHCMMSANRDLFLRWII